MKQQLAFLCLAMMAATACSRSDQAGAGGAPPPQKPGPHSGADPGLEGMTQAASSPADVAILYDLPAGWTRVKPTSKMRMDQASIPGASGNGELAVFFFGVGGGGGVEANFDMWAELVEGGKPVRATFEHGGFKVSWLEAAGTVMPSGMTGMSKTIPNGRLLGAVVEGEGGPWYFKATGPDATITAQKEPFLAMLRSIRPNPAAPKTEKF